MSSSGLSMLGDIANIVIAVASVATAIVTARMLIKQHKLQLKQHSLEREKHLLEERKLKAQQQEHQPAFYFKRHDDCLEICNSGERLAHPIKFHIQSYMYIFVYTIQFGRIIEYPTLIPLRVYNECICQEELDGVVAKCNFNKQIRDELHTTCKTIVDTIGDNQYFQIRAPYISGIGVRDCDLITIEYTDIYKQTHRLFYNDSFPVTEETYGKILKAMQNTCYKPKSIERIDIQKIIQEVVQFKYIKNW